MLTILPKLCNSKTAAANAWQRMDTKSYEICQRAGFFVDLLFNYCAMNSK